MMCNQWDYQALNKFVEVKHGVAFKSNCFCDKGPHVLPVAMLKEIERQ